MTKMIKVFSNEVASFFLEGEGGWDGEPAPKKSLTEVAKCYAIKLLVSWILQT